MMKKDAESLLRETKAILEGHFLLTSGLHSPPLCREVQCTAAP